MTRTKSGGQGRRDARRHRGHDRDRPTAETQRQRDRFERLLAAGLAIFAEHDLETLLQRVADAAREVVGARYAALGVLSEEGTGLAQFVTSGLSAAKRTRIGALPQGRGLLGLLIRERRAIRTADITRHPARHGFPPHHPSMKSFLGVPIVIRDQVFGNLYLTEKLGASEFGSEDERIARFLARKAAVAVENARLLGRLREFQASRDRFYAMMNHELRNALTGVYGWLDLLVRRDREAAPSQAVEALAAAEHSVQLLNDLLDLSRLDAGRLEIKPQRVMAEAMLAEALHAVAPLAEAGDVRLEAPGLERRTATRTDPKRVRQILVNLLRNAIQHTPPAAAVRVVLGADDGLVWFAVIDPGQGIDPEVAQRLFEAYARGSEERAGTGLGLTLSRRLARLLGGDLDVQSQLGHGATFTVSIARFVSAGV